jgi:Zn-dependent M28 family amino/carboxypeptidase
MNHPHRLFAALLALCLGAVLTVVTPPSYAGPDDRRHDKGCNKINSVDTLLRCVTLQGVMEHEKALQKIADANGGTRASGTSGFDASATYVAKRLRKAGYRISTQTFQYFSFAEAGPSMLQQLTPTPTTYVEDTDFAPTPHSEPGDVTAAVTPVDLQLGLGNTSTSGCEDTDFTDFPEGNIALIQRGSCTFEIKGENAAEAGASAVLFFNQGNTDTPDRMGIPAVTLGNGYTGGIPALNATYTLGETLAGLDDLTMRLHANVTREDGETSNVIAESKWGDPHNVVMAGAHLDSVGEGPGINDNGSGSSALLETAEQMRKIKPANKVRFAWWGGEEGGLVGSTFYVDSLSEDQLADLEMYLNFDMVASPNYGLFRYDGDGSDFGTAGPDGSDEIEALFTRYYTERGHESEASPFNGRSDYQAFILNGVPAGGLFTGAEGTKTEAQAAKWGGTADAPYDGCYHQACDTIDNVNRDALQINADAIAYVTYLYATGGETIND